VALALASLAGLTLDRITVAKIAQQAENDYVGMRCGIMDPFTSVFGKSGHALKIDCRSLAHELVPLGRVTGGSASVRIVICNTQVKHQLAGSEYNRRRLECEQGMWSLKRFAPDFEALRDVSPAFLEEHRADLDPVIYRRCRHVVTEDVRVVAASAALWQGKLDQFGALMAESHQSLQRDFEVSCPELDLLVDLAQSMKGVYGARMTGGGFGGCTVNLVRLDQVLKFRSLIAARYTAKTGLAPEIYVCEAAEGAGPVEHGTFGSREREA
jgi:galactokinase